MNNPIDQNENVKSKLIQLLDYVAHQAADAQKIQYEISGPQFYSNELMKLPGLTLLEDGEWWFQIERLKLPVLPQPNATLASVIDISNDIEPKIKQSHLDSILSFQKTKSKFLQSHTQRRNFIYRVGIVQQLFDILKYYQDIWKSWKADSDEIRKLIAVYDKLFTWNTAINLGGASDGLEIIAGFALVDWILPTSKKTYSYPLISIPLEMEIEKDGIIRVGAQDTRANIEMDALLLEDDLSTSGQVKLALKEHLNNGRVLELFHGESYSDLVEAFVATIFSRGSVNEDAHRLAPSAELAVTLSSVLFSRPRQNTILSDDVELLKAQLNLDSIVIPEQPLSLVTAVEDSVTDKTSFSFRGRSGIEGFGANTQERYFPLAYNKEQITIVQNLLSSSGVVVQGPPGTGKTHSIANIICHYLANGKKVLVTAQQAHVLKTVHEKIPEELKPLVVSRIGSSKESKNQLESSIDLIVQKITQMNIADVQREIEVLKQQIDQNHFEMALIDREIYNFAEKHYQNIEVDGNKKRPMDIVQSLVEKRAAYAWFTDPLTLLEKDQMPWSQAELIQLRDSRKKCGADLSFINHTRLPDMKHMLDLVDLKKLNAALQQQQQIQQVLQSNDQHIFKAEVTLKSVEDFKVWLQDDLDAMRLVLDTAEPWLRHFFDKMNAEDMRIELEVYSQLIQEAQPLLSYRKALLSQPITLNFEISNRSAEYQAIQRAVETGKAFHWYHFGRSELQQRVDTILISGTKPDTQQQWQAVQTYIDQIHSLETFMSKWQGIATQFSLPIIHLNEQDFDQTLKQLSYLVLNTEQCLKLKQQYLDQ